MTLSECALCRKLVFNICNRRLGRVGNPYNKGNSRWEEWGIPLEIVVDIGTITVFGGN